MMDDNQYIVISITDDPEADAAAFMSDQLPETYLDQIDISTDGGRAKMMACLVKRQHQISMEKDEILRFAQCNRAVLLSGDLDELTLIVSRLKEDKHGERIGHFLEYFTKQVRYALAGEVDKIDIKSDKLLWIVHAAALCISAEKISYQKALTILNKEEYRSRISPFSLRVMLKDCFDYIGHPSQPPTEYLMLVIECGLLHREEIIVLTGGLLLCRSNPPKDKASLLDLLKRTESFLHEVGKLSDRVKSEMERVFARYQREVPEDDF